MEEDRIKEQIDNLCLKYKIEFDQLKRERKANTDYDIVTQFHNRILQQYLNDEFKKPKVKMRYGSFNQHPFYSKKFKEAFKKYLLKD